MYSVSSKYFWLTQYWRLPTGHTGAVVTILNIYYFPQITKPFTVSCLQIFNLNRTELSILWLTARHLWTRALCHQECGDKQLISTHSGGIFSMHFSLPPRLPVSDVSISSVSGVLTLQGPGLRADPPPAPALNVCSGNI